MPGGLVPDRVRHRVGPVAEPGDRLGERQRGALGGREIGGVPPGPHRGEAFVALAQLPQLARVQVQAHAAAVDLARAQLDQAQGLGGRALVSTEACRARRASRAPGRSTAGWAIRACMGDAS